MNNPYPKSKYPIINNKSWILNALVVLENRNLMAYSNLKNNNFTKNP